jgi:ABC-type branched-subunit amino acid transport system ATPase component
VREVSLRVGAGEVVALLGKRLRQLPERGITLLLIDHDMSLVLEVCDRILVIDFGKLIAEGTPDEIRTNQRVIDAYLGRQSGQGDEQEVDR